MAIYPANLHEIANMQAWALTALEVLIIRNGGKIEISREEYKRTEDTKQIIRQNLNKEQDILILTVEPLPEELRQGVNYMYTPEDITLSDDESIA